MKAANQAELNQWTLTGDGVGIHCGILNEDLSLKDPIKESALLSILNRLDNKKDKEELFVL